MSRRSWKKLIRKASEQQINDKSRNRFQPAVEQLEELTLPSGIHPTYVLLTQRGSSVNTPFDGPGSGALTPSQIRTAYGINGISFNGTAGTGAGQTIAIVDAYDDPNIASDLATFDTYYNLEPMNAGAGTPTFTKIGATGSTTNLPSPDQGWATEISLDVEWAHVVAPMANIVLVEGNSASSADLLAAVSTGANYTGVTALTMSWGGSEDSSEASDDTYFTTPANHPNVTFFASSGDNGGPISWPAVSTHVVGVGGTTLSVDSSGDYEGESAWGGSQGSLSTYLSAPSWQSGLVIHSGSSTISARGMRASPDVSYDADPNSGVGIYDTLDGGWEIVGGTSAASPQWAGLMAITNQGLALAGKSSLDGPSQTLPDIYKLPATDFNDVTTGGNSGYSAGNGFDLVTGFGSPKANLVVEALAGYSGSSGGNGKPPTITTPASYNAKSVTPTSVQLTVLATGNPSSDPLTYTWSLTGTPPASVKYSDNADSTAFNTTVTFSKVGSYSFVVTVADATPGNGQTATSGETYTLNVTPTTITLSPTNTTVNDSGTKQFTATVADQFGANLATQPSDTWSVSAGLGSINGSGLYTAPSTGSGSSTVKAVADGLSATTTITYSAAKAPTINGITVLYSVTTAKLEASATDPYGLPIVYTWSVIGTPPGTVTFSPNGSTASATTIATFSAAGSYTIQLSVADSNNVSATKTATATFTSTLSYLVVTPTSATLAPSATQQFTAVAQDQFHNPMNTATYAWSAVSGKITTAGLYTAPASGVSDTVTVVATVGRATEKVQVPITISGGATILFQDNFSAGLGNWTVLDGLYGLQLGLTGVSRMVVQNTGGLSRIVAGSSSWTNYSYQAILTILNSSLGSASLMARVQDANHFYYFGYSTAVGEWFIGLQNGASVTSILAYSQPSVVNFGVDYNVEANLYNSTLTLDVNGVQMVAATDSTFTSGRIGFTASNAIATLGNVVVTALNGPQFARPLVSSGSSSSTGTTTTVAAAVAGGAPFTGALVTGYAPGGGTFTAAFILSGTADSLDLATALGSPLWNII